MNQVALNWQLPSYQCTGTCSHVSCIQNDNHENLQSLTAIRYGLKGTTGLYIIKNLISKIMEDHENMAFTQTYVDGLINAKQMYW